VTEGPGAIVSKSLEESVRQHKDISKEAAPHYKKAKKFYEGLSAELVKNGHVMDIFACALDQVGLAEMKVVVHNTGGVVVLAESFEHPVFKQSFARMISRDGEGALGLASRGTFEVRETREDTATHRQTATPAPSLCRCHTTHCTSTLVIVGVACSSSSLSCEGYNPPNRLSPFKLLPTRYKPTALGGAGFIICCPTPPRCWIHVTTAVISQPESCLAYSRRIPVQQRRVLISGRPLLRPTIRAHRCSRRAT
jgi:hypothetical protein